MATRYIDTRLRLEGENEYKAGIKSTNAELRQLNSELTLLTTKYANNANSLEALTAKGKTLTDMYSVQSDKLNIYQSALDAAQRKHAEYGADIDKYKQQLAEAEKELEDLKNSTEDTTEAQEKQKQKIAELQKQLEAAEAGQQKASNTVTYYKTQVNKAETELTKLDKELVKNRQYMAEAEASATKTAKSINEFGQETKKSSDAIEGLAGALAAAGITATLKEITDALIAASKASLEFESAFTGVTKTVDGTEAELKVIADGIKQMALEIPKSTTEIAGVAEAAGQLGIKTKDILAFTEVMTNLGVATNLTAQEAATMLAQFANITQMDASKYSNLGAAIVDLGNNFATTESKITEMSLRLAGAATIAGFAETDILGIAAAVASLGIEAQAGGSSISKLISTLQAAVETGAGLEDFAKTAGMSAKEFAYLWGTDAVGALQAFIIGLGNAEKSGKSAIVTLDNLGITEIRMRQAILGLANSGDLLTRSVETANKAWTENAALTVEAQKRYATTESKFALFKNSVNNLSIAIGDRLNPMLAKAAEAGANAFQWAADFVEDNPWVVGAVTALVSAFTVLTAGIGGYIVITKLAAAAQAAFNAVLAANPIFLIVTAVAAASAALGVFIASIEDSTVSVKDLTTAAREADKALKEIGETYTATESKITTSANLAQTYADRLKELESIGLDNVAAQQEYAGIVDRLNALIPSLNIEIDKQTGLIKGGTVALRDNITAWREQAIAAALQKKETEEAEKYVDVLTEMRDNTVGYTKATKDRETVEKKHYELLERISNLTGVSTEELSEYTARQRASLAQTLAQKYGLGGLVQEFSSYIFEVKAAKREEAAYAEAVDISTAKVREMQEVLGLSDEAMQGYLETLGVGSDANAEYAASYDPIMANLQGVQTEIDALTERYNTVYNEAYESITGQIGLFDDFSFSVSENVKKATEDMIAAWNKQSENINNYAENLRKAAKYGISEGLVREWSDGSKESAGYIADVIKRIEDLGVEQDKLSDDADEFVKEFNAAYAETTEAKESFADTVAAIATDFDEKMSQIEEKIKETMLELDQADAAYSYAEQTAQSYADGAKAKWNAVYNAYKSLAQAANKGWTDTFEQRSPSKLAIRTSEQTAESYAIGPKNKEKDVREAYSDLAKASNEAFEQNAAMAMQRMASFTSLAMEILPLLTGGGMRGGVTIQQTNNFNGGYAPRDGAAAVRDLNRKLGGLLN